MYDLFRRMIHRESDNLWRVLFRPHHTHTLEECRICRVDTSLRLIHECECVLDAVVFEETDEGIQRVGV